MSVEDVEVAKRFSRALDVAFATGDQEGVYALFADDVEYTTPHRTLRGLSEVREKLEWGGGEPENLDVEFEEGEWQDLGGGHVVRESRVVQRWKETGEVAATMRVHLDLTIREGKITATNGKDSRNSCRRLVVPVRSEVRTSRWQVVTP